MTPCRQKILVKGRKLAFWELDGSGRWECLLECVCGHGRAGFSRCKREGDGCTPVGTFPLEMCFGTGEDPGALLPYRRIGPDSWWSGEREDYNRWAEAAPGSRDMSSSEHLADYPVQYRYAMSIGYNTADPEWGAGSAIFLHCIGANGLATAGCISVPEPAALYLATHCGPGALIQIFD